MPERSSATVCSVSGCRWSIHVVSFGLAISSLACSSAPDFTPSGSASSTSAAAEAEFTTLPPGSELPSDAECAQRVVKAAEIRPGNEPYNSTRGKQKNLVGPYYSRVTGDFAGTTDEILQWAACKWGIDVDIVRGQAAKESYWNMAALGDFADDPSVCLPGHPIGADDEPDKCPESAGMLQMRYQYSGPPGNFDTWPEAVESTAYHLDFVYSYWRTCYEGLLTWLNSTTDRVGTYAAGDEWGCVGNWFAGRWRTPPAEEYIAAIEGYIRDRIWESAQFVSYR